MGGVYRIQTFLDFYIFFNIYKAPKLLCYRTSLVASLVKQFVDPNPGAHRQLEGVPGHFPG